jgi:hypothetical protein
VRPALGERTILPPDVGAEDTADVGAAQDFRQTRMVDVPLMVVPGGGHQASVWRAALGPMLSWMTPQLAVVAKQADATADGGVQEALAPRRRWRQIGREMNAALFRSSHAQLPLAGVIRTICGWRNGANSCASPAADSRIWRPNRID